MDDSDLKITVLCLGPKGSGKTTLLKKLQDAEGIDYTYSPVPTIGTNIYDVNYVNKHGKKQVLTIREVGGEMASLWNNYFDGIEKVIFVVDTSNLCQISAAAVMLYTLLAEPKLKNAKAESIWDASLENHWTNFDEIWYDDSWLSGSIFRILFIAGKYLISEKSILTVKRKDELERNEVLSKMDAAYRQMRNEALLMLQCARLSTELQNAPIVLEASPLTGEGLDTLRAYISENKRLTLAN